MALLSSFPAALSSKMPACMSAVRFPASAGSGLAVTARNAAATWLEARGLYFRMGFDPLCIVETCLRSEERSFSQLQIFGRFLPRSGFSY